SLIVRLEVTSRNSKSAAVRYCPNQSGIWARVGAAHAALKASKQAASCRLLRWAIRHPPCRLTIWSIRCVTPVIRPDHKDNSFQKKSKNKLAGWCGRVDRFGDILG